MEEGKEISSKRILRLFSDGYTLNSKVYRKSRKNDQVSSPTTMDEVNDCPSLVWKSHKYRVSKTKVKNELKRLKCEEIEKDVLI